MLFKYFIIVNSTFYAMPVDNLQFVNLATYIRYVAEIAWMTFQSTTTTFIHSQGMSRMTWIQFEEGSASCLIYTKENLCNARQPQIYVRVPNLVWILKMVMIKNSRLNSQFFAYIT